MEQFAYIDPFTGSLVLQVLAMTFFSILVFFQKVKAFVLGLFGLKPKNIESLDEEPLILKMDIVDTESKRQDKKAA